MGDELDIKKQAHKALKEEIFTKIYGSMQGKKKQAEVEATRVMAAKKVLRDEPPELMKRQGRYEELATGDGISRAMKTTATKFLKAKAGSGAMEDIHTASFVYAAASNEQNIAHFFKSLASDVSTDELKTLQMQCGSDETDDILMMLTTDYCKQQVGLMVKACNALKSQATLQAARMRITTHEAKMAAAENLRKRINNPMDAYMNIGKKPRLTRAASFLLSQEEEEASQEFVEASQGFMDDEAEEAEEAAEAEAENSQLAIDEDEGDLYPDDYEEL
tara:strand:- start:165 stop:992 length:828 start_codon:yes stop_codon:yes gene_type:complete